MGITLVAPTRIARSQKKQTFTASSTVAGMKRTDAIDTPYEFDQLNRFMRYQQLVVTTPHVTISLLKTARALVKNGRFKSKDEAKAKKWNDWYKRVGMQNQVNSLASLYLMNGIYCGIFQGKTADDLTIVPLLMPLVTIWPKGFDPTAGNLKPEHKILAGEPEYFVVNESSKDKKLFHKYKADEVIYAAFCPYHFILTDTQGRNTWGLYGLSLLEPITDTIFKYLTITDGFANFVHKYGQGRLHVDYEALASLIEQNQLKDAMEMLQVMIDTVGSLEENEDIVTTGAKITPITMQGSIDVTNYKQSLESDIQIGLLQSGLTMGNTESTTYASGYIAEDERLSTLEAIQSDLVLLFNQQIVRKRKEMLNLPEDDDIEFVCDEISKQTIAPADLMMLFKGDAITKNELREDIGKEATEEEINNEADPAMITAVASAEASKITAQASLEAAKHPPSGVGSGNGAGSGNPADPRKPAQAVAARKSQDTRTAPAKKKL